MRICKEENRSINETVVSKQSVYPSINIIIEYTGRLYSVHYDLFVLTGIPVIAVRTGLEDHGADCYRLSECGLLPAKHTICHVITLLMPYDR